MGFKNRFKDWVIGGISHKPIDPPQKLQKEKQKSKRKGESGESSLYHEEIPIELEGWMETEPSIPPVSTRLMGEGISMKKAGASGLHLIVLDNSGSMCCNDYKPSRLSAAKRAAERFIEVISSNDAGAFVGIVSFNDTARVESEPVSVTTEDRGLRKAINAIKESGGTHLLSGLNVVCSEIDAFWPRLMPMWVGNTRIVILTDGETCDEEQSLSVAESLKRRRVLIEVIGIGGRPSAVNERFLRKVASTTPDGVNHYWFIDQYQGATALVKKFEQLATGIRAGR